jgi:iron complex outermembrane recepter protein
MKYIKVYLTIIVSFISLATAAAQSGKGGIAGRILDAQSQTPLPGATVFLPDLNRGTATDTDGNFEIKDLPAGRFSVQVTFIGFEKKVVPVTVRETTTAMKVSLDPSSFTAQEVVVSGAYTVLRERSPVPIEAMDARALVQGGATTLVEGLTRIAGVEQISYGAGIGKPVIRGMSFSRVLTVYQGARFENHQWGADHGLGLNDFGVSKIEVVKGPASLIYGSGAVGGVLNVIDEKPALAGQVEGDYNISTFSNTLGLKTNAGVKGASQNGFYWRIRGGLESHADYVDGNGNPVGNSRFGTNTLKTSVGLNKGWGTSNLSYTYHRQRLGIIEEDENEESLATFRNDRSMQLPFQNVTDHVISTQNQFFLGESRLRLNMAYHTNLREEIEEDFQEVDLGLVQRNFTYDLKYHLPSKGNEEFIIGVQGFQLTNRNYKDAGEILIPDAWVQDYSLFGLSNFEWDRVTLQGGIRYDYRITTADASGQNFLDYGFVLPGAPADRTLKRTFSGFSGSMGTSIRATEELQLRANLSSGFRAPDLAELFSNGPHPGTNRFESGNANFGREQNLQFDVGATYRKNGWMFEAGTFVNRVNDYVFFRPTDLMMGDLIVWQFEQDNVILYGGEAGFEFNPEGAKWLLLRSNFSMVIGERVDSAEPLPLIPANRFNHEVNLRADKLGIIQSPFVMLRLQNVFNQARIDSDELVTPGYNLFSVGVGGNVNMGGQPVEISLAGTNLFNESYVDHLSLLRPFNILNMGRNISMTVRIPLLLAKQRSVK